MLDDIEESRPIHSIEIVEKPPYANDKSGPVYSGLAAKEKDAEVSTLYHRHLHIISWALIIIFTG